MGVEVHSESRTGIKDFGMNRRRIEEFLNSMNSNPNLTKAAYR
jgi:uncharacterized protein (DUF1499 family)